MPESHLQTVAMIAEARHYLKATHRTYRSASAELGVTPQHICYVLNSQRKSIPLLKRILALPKHRPVDL